MDKDIKIFVKGELTITLSEEIIKDIQNGERDLREYFEPKEIDWFIEEWEIGD